ncbi:MAG: hypothetical protein M3Y30_15790 [Gemmatimonadota bacterium]|nr:hypothetical protein [Gemmatimonadota bacterium]
MQIDTDRFDEHRRKFLDADFRELPIHDHKEPIEGTIEPPSRLADLIAVAEALARDTDFVRIDCYQVGDRTCLGEMTHTPGTGLSPLYPTIWDDRWGAMWERRAQ